MSVSMEKHSTMAAICLRSIEKSEEKEYLIILMLVIGAGRLSAGALSRNLKKDPLVLSYLTTLLKNSLNLDLSLNPSEITLPQLKMYRLNPGFNRDLKTLRPTLTST